MSFNGILGKCKSYLIYRGWKLELYNPCQPRTGGQPMSSPAPRLFFSSFLLLSFFHEADLHFLFSLCRCCCLSTKQKCLPPLLFPRCSAPHFPRRKNPPCRFILYRTLLCAENYLPLLWLLFLVQLVCVVLIKVLKCSVCRVNVSV